MAGSGTRKVSAASARAHTRKSSQSRSTNPFRLSSTQIAVGGVLLSFLVYVYIAIQPAAPKICGSPGGPPVTSPRVELSDGRHLAYKEKGVPRDEAKYKIIVCHGWADSKDFNLRVSEELIKELSIYILSFDRAGYGESDPNPTRSVESEAFDIQELADKLQLGPKFYLLGISVGAYPVYSCLKYIPHRVAGAALVVPFVNYWWNCFPAELAKESLNGLVFQYQWTFRVAHYVPWLLNWWLTQTWFPSLSVMQGELDIYSRSDLAILEKLSGTLNEGQEQVRQQGDHECLHRDMMVAFGKWEFEPTDISNPFPNNEGAVHMWQGYNDKLVPFELNRYLSKQIPWIQYHEIPDAGHFLIQNATHCEAIFKAFVSS